MRGSDWREGLTDGVKRLELDCCLAFEHLRASQTLSISLAHRSACSGDEDTKVFLWLDEREE